MAQQLWDDGVHSGGQVSWAWVAIAIGLVLFWFALGTVVAAIA